MATRKRAGKTTKGSASSKGAARKTTKKAATKKAATKKAATKKAATKKSATKKAATKKAATKKAATKKSATKKSATKKSATKKSATKKSATKKSAGKKATARKSGITPRKALANTRKLLAAKQQQARETPPWQQLDKGPGPQAPEGYQSGEAAAKARELHEGEMRLQANQGSISTHDRHEQGRRDKG